MPVVNSSDSQSRLQEVLSKIRKTPNGDHSPASGVFTGGTAKKPLVSSHTPTRYRQPEPVVEKVQIPGPEAAGSASGHSGSASGHTVLTGEREKPCTSKASEDGCGPRYYSVMW